ncbi:hypothetical protein V5799_006662, partial [Amblyomma americanum]
STDSGVTRTGYFNVRGIARLARDETVEQEFLENWITAAGHRLREKGAAGLLREEKYWLASPYQGVLYAYLTNLVEVSHAALAGPLFYAQKEAGVLRAASFGGLATAFLDAALRMFDLRASWISEKLKKRKPKKLPRSRQAECIVLATVFLVLVVAVAVAVYYRYSPLSGGQRFGADDHGVCASADCKLHASFFRRRLDTRIDPCADFDAYVCSLWSPASGLARDLVEEMALSWTLKAARFLTKETSGGRYDANGSFAHDQTVVLKNNGGKANPPMLVIRKTGMAAAWLDFVDLLDKNGGRRAYYKEIQSVNETGREAVYTTVARLESLFSNLNGYPLSRTILSVFKSSGIVAQSGVYITDRHFLAATDWLLGKYNRRQLLEHIDWWFAQICVVMASRKARMLVMSSEDGSRMLKTSRCLETAAAWFGPVRYYMSDAEDFAAERREGVDRFLRGLTAQTQRALAATTWVDEHTRRVMEQRLRDLRVVAWVEQLESSGGPPQDQSWGSFSNYWYDPKKVWPYL